MDRGKEHFLDVELCSIAAPASLVKFPVVQCRLVQVEIILEIMIVW